MTELSRVQKITSFTGICVAMAAIHFASHNRLLFSFVKIPFAVAPYYAQIFEYHFWQFSFAMIAMTILSRGNLWSYGINSIDVRVSMTFLLKFYLTGIVFGFVAVIAQFYAMPNIGTLLFREKIAVIIIQWMSSPIADQVFYFGLFQTVLMKLWDKNLSVASFHLPVAVIFSSVLFALSRSTLPTYLPLHIEQALAVAIGIFSGYVYHTTRSLLTPMLAQAFFFGFPHFLKLIMR